MGTFKAHNWALCIHREIFPACLPCHNLLKVLILAFELVCDVFPLDELSLERLYGLFQIDGFLKKVLLFISELLQLQKEISSLLPTLVSP